MNPPSESDLAIVILNYNGYGWLTRFLPTLIANSPKQSVYVIDNASTDASLTYLESWPEVLLIRLKQNYGFCEGYNLGIRQIEKPYLILINSDVEVTEGWYAPLLEKLGEPGVGACQPKIKSYTDKTRFEYAGAAGGLMDAWALPYCYGRKPKGTEIDSGQYEVERTIFWASGACMAIKREVFRAMGGFDPLFFAHMEEIDLCWRIQLAGYKNWYVPKSTVYHVGGGTLNVQSPFKTYLNHRNNLFTIYKNYGEGRFSLILWRLLLDGAIGLAYSFTKGPKHTLAVIKAHINFYQNAGKLSPSEGNGSNFLTKKKILLSPL